MKIITTLLAIIGFNSAVLSQTSALADLKANVNPASASEMQYSEATAALETPNPGPVKTREILITSLPPQTQSLTPLNIEFGLTGSFTFKKDATLELYENVDVYIEDMLTGKVFNLKNSESYSFNVNRRVPGRFVLHIDKNIFKYELSSLTR